jgi:predicted metal-dependent phosphoesterase TrpH
MSSTDLLRIDLHVHTWGSWDCLSDPERVLERAAERGVRRIAITDHNEVDVALEMARRYPDRVIPGEEVRTAEGVDVIGLYLSDRIPEGTSAEEACERVHSMGGLAYLPHPFARGKGGSGRLAEALTPLVDIVEVFNARLHPTSLNTPAADLASRWDRPSGAGSDAHSLWEVAGAYVELPDHPNDPLALVRALKDGSVQGRSAPWAVHLISTWAKIRRKLPGGP